MKAIQRFLSLLYANLSRVETAPLAPALSHVYTDVVEAGHAGAQTFLRC